MTPNSLVDSTSRRARGRRRRSRRRDDGRLGRGVGARTGRRRPGRGRLRGAARGAGIGRRAGDRATPRPSCWSVSAGTAGRGSGVSPRALRVVGGRDRLDERRVHRDVRVDLLARHELELVDDALVVGVGHREEDAVAPHEHRQDAVRLGQLARHDVEVLEQDGDLREVDARDAVLLGERAERVDLARPSRRRSSCDARGAGVTRSLLGAQRRVELLLGHQLALEQDLAERPLLVAGGHGRRLWSQYAGAGSRTTPRAGAAPGQYESRGQPRSASSSARPSRTARPRSRSPPGRSPRGRRPRARRRSAGCAARAAAGTRISPARYRWRRYARE